MDIDALVNEKLEADSDFQAEIETLSDDEKETAIAGKKQELVKSVAVELAEKAAKNEELYNNAKIRAEKAERKQVKPAPQGDDLTPKDWMHLAKADVHDDDIDRVVKFSKLEGISVQEALKHPDLKAILSSRAEVRKSAEATSVKPSSRGAQKIAPDVIVAEAAKGKIPQAGTPEAEELFWARRGGRR